MTSNTPRTVVLGFDALAMQYLEAFDLPNFDSIRDRGVSTALRATFPPWTGSAWPSMYTGVEPSHHGVYSFFDFDDRYPDEGELVTRNDVRSPALWNYLTEEGLSSAVLNLPVTHPAEPIDGTLIPGYLAAEDAPGYPEGIRDELDEALGEPYRIYATEETGEADEEMLQSYVDLIDLRRRAAKFLLETKHPDVAVLQVQKTDTVFHQFDDRESFRRVYEAADEFLGTVLDVVAEDTNVIVCSDHGIGPTRGYNVYVNQILADSGMVEETRDGQTPTLGSNKRQLAGEIESTDDSVPLSRRAMSRLVSALERMGIEPGDVYATASRIGADETLRRLLPDAAFGSISRHVDWPASKAYCRSGPELGIRINLEGREPNGVVPESEYETVRDRIIRTLTTTRTPDDEPVFDWVKRREAVYDGPLADGACDVLFQPAGMNHVVATNLLGKQFVSIDKYNHKLDGVFVASGPDVDASTDVGPLALTDVAPIVMALSASTVPDRMTGSVPTGLLEVPFDVRSYGDIQYGGGSGSKEDDRVEARLEDLGYL